MDVYSVDLELLLFLYYTTIYGVNTTPLKTSGYQSVPDPYKI